MSITVKPPLFVSTPDDKLVVVDVYAGGSTPLQPVNLLKSVSNVADNALGKALGGMQKNGINVLMKAATFALTNPSFNSKEFTKHMVGEVFPNAKAALNDLKGGLMNSLSASLGFDANTALSAYRAVKDGDFNDIMGTLAGSNPLAKLYIDGHEIVKRAEDIDSLGELFSVASDLTGNSKIGRLLNLGDEFKVLKGLVDTAIDLGAPELADYLIGEVNGEHKAPLERAIAQSAAKKGDITTLYSYIYTMNVAEAVNEDPYMPYNFMKNYSHPHDDGPRAEVVNMMVAILDQLNPDWAGAITGRPDVSMWRDLSSDMRELIYLDGRYTYLAAAALDTEEESLEQSAARTMDWIVLNSGTRQNLI